MDQGSLQSFASSSNDMSFLAIPYDVVASPLLSRLLSFDDGLALLLTCRTLYHHPRVMTDFWSRHLVVVRLNPLKNSRLELQWTRRFMRDVHRILESGDGVPESSLAQIETQLQLSIPPDVRLFLRLGLPSEFGRFDHVDKYVQYARQQWQWHACPVGYEQYKLLPICGHRMIPTVPCREQNPVYSMHQCDPSDTGDNIVYGENFFLWLIEEKFLSADDIPEDVKANISQDEVPFWKDFIF